MIERAAEGERAGQAGWCAGARGDVTMSMPPYTRLVLVQASASPAFAHYHVTADGRYQAWAIIVLDVDGDRITAWNSFLDTEKLFPLFGLPLVLPEDFFSRDR